MDQIASPKAKMLRMVAKIMPLPKIPKAHKPLPLKTSPQEKLVWVKCA
jgi:hypothetical protein